MDSSLQNRFAVTWWWSGNDAKRRTVEDRGREGHAKRRDGSRGGVTTPM